MFKHADYFMMKYDWYRAIPTKEVKVGSKFGKWTVLKNIRYKNPDWDYDPDALWQCQCECGRKRQLTSFRLNMIVRNHEMRGEYEGCQWCRYEEKFGKRTQSSQQKERRRLFQVWENMRQRCNNPSNRMYKDYGGRGINVCDEWNTHFQPFYEYVISLEHYGEPGRSIDRIDNEKGYYPGNVRWATQKEQCNNRRPRKKPLQRGKDE